jgi:hypothetical protein
MSIQTSEKKVVSRKVAIVLGTACILLLAVLGATIIVYQSRLSDKDREISNLNEQIVVLSSQVANLSAIVNLNRSAVWVNSKNVTIQAGYEIIWNATAYYAGYVSVLVFPSTMANASAAQADVYVQVTYSSHGVNYDNRIDVGVGGTAVFPVLPSPLIQIIVGNPGVNVADKVITATYYY